MQNTVDISSLRGWLMKEKNNKEPNILVSTYLPARDTRRYFIVEYVQGEGDDSKELALRYYKNIPKSKHDEPSGWIFLNDVTRIDEDTLQRQFILHHPSRVFRLRCPDETEQEIWVNGVKLLCPDAEVYKNGYDTFSGSSFPFIPRPSQLPIHDKCNEMNTTTNTRDEIHAQLSFMREIKGNNKNEQFVSNLHDFEEMKNSFPHQTENQFTSFNDESNASKVNSNCNLEQETNHPCINDPKPKHRRKKSASPTKGRNHNRRSSKIAFQEHVEDFSFDTSSQMNCLQNSPLKSPSKLTETTNERLNRIIKSGWTPDKISEQSPLKTKSSEVVESDNSNEFEIPATINLGRQIFFDDTQKLTDENEASSFLLNRYEINSGGFNNNNHNRQDYFSESEDDDDSIEIDLEKEKERRASILIPAHQEQRKNLTCMNNCSLDENNGVNGNLENLGSEPDKNFVTENWDDDDDDNLSVSLQQRLDMTLNTKGKAKPFKSSDPTAIKPDDNFLIDDWDE